MSWFKNWFDSPYYHVLYKERDNQEAKLFIDNLIKKLNLKQGNKLIDIACGKGRHANYFNKKGMHVVGIDLSQNSIAIAKQYENDSLSFNIHDMRKVFKENYFNIGVNLFTSFGYFKNKKDNSKALDAMARNLKKDGLLIIDFMNVKKVITNLIPKEEKIINSIKFNIKKQVKGEYIIKEITITDGYIKQKFQEKVTIIDLAEFNNLITTSGLKIINTFGNYKLEDFNALTSERLILICKK